MASAAETGASAHGLLWWRRAAAIDATCVSSRLRIAEELLRVKQAPAAVRILNDVLALSPEREDELFRLARLLKGLGVGWLAHAVYRRLLALDPANFASWGNLSNLDLARGQHRQACAAAWRASSIDPGDAVPWKRLLGIHLYFEAAPDRLALLHRRVAHKLGIDVPGPSVVARRAGASRVRVGFISSDFCEHPVAGNVRALFRYRDRGAWTPVIYSNVGQPDEITGWFRENVDEWHDISAESEGAIEAKMKSDGLDVLVFLAGRFNANWAFVRDRYAPVQVAFHDGATSASACMDYWISDPVLHPAESAEWFSERLARLPVFYNFEPPPGPSGKARPATATFGAFNSPAKISTASVVLWSRVLRAVPAARLLLKYGSSMTDPQIQARIGSLFAAEGIDLDRLIFLGASSERREHLAAFACVDVALDTFPFTGATTTFECLWMGTPVVTLAGATFVQRMAASILHHAGLGELAATSESEYVRLAVELAGSPARLAALRAGMRQQVMRSPLCDGPRYAAEFDGLLRGLVR